MQAHLSHRSNAGEFWYEHVKKWSQEISSTLCRVAGDAGYVLIKGSYSLVALFSIRSMSLCQRFWVWWLMAHLAQHKGIMSDSILLVCVPSYETKFAHTSVKGG